LHTRHGFAFAAVHGVPVLEISGTPLGRGEIAKRAPARRIARESVERTASASRSQRAAEMRPELRAGSMPAWKSASLA